MDILLQLVLLAAGFVMLIKGADWFVDGAAGIAAKMGIPQLVIGLTIVAMGTSAPETAVSLSSAFKGSADISVGNVVGSNVMNVLVILGLTSVISKLKVQKSTVRYEIPFMIAITLVLLGLGMTGQELVLWEGIVLWALFIVYLLYLFWMARKNPEDSGEEIDASKPLWKMLLAIVVGIVVIVLGSNISVDAAVKIAQRLGVSERIIGLTIVALGTSLPELVTSVTAARKGSADIAIGNIVGSNIFNILFVLGTTALIIPVPFAPNFRIDALIATGAGLLLLLFAAPKKTLGKAAGLTMLACYAGYFVYLLNG